MSEQDEKLLSKATQIPDEEVRQDIAETLAEIAKWEQEAEHLEQTPLSLPSARWDHVRAYARRTRIMEAKAFVEKLQRLLELRKVKR